MRSTLAVAVVLTAFLNVAAAWAQAGSTDALSKFGESRRDDGLRSQVVAAEQAVANEEWPQAIAAWQALSQRRVDEASPQLCRLYFDARQGNFDAARTTDWCRRAAGAGDANALYRIGLLYLVGFAVDKNVAQAQAFCEAAALRDAQVPAKFCLAAVAREQAHFARSTLADMRNHDGTLIKPGDAAVSGSAAMQPEAAKAGSSARDMCDRVFIAAGAAFDAAAVTKWCGMAADAGDAVALHRMGLMHLFGLGGGLDLERAKGDCTRAQMAGGGHLSAAFCLAAVSEKARATAGRGLALILDQQTGRPLPTTMPDPFAIDRILDEPRKTSSGLDYTCRKMADWARFEVPGLVILKPRDMLFGRAILDYRRQDFDDLGRAAGTCETAIATIAYNAGLRHDLDDFRASIADMKTRQSGLQVERRQGSAEAAQLAHDQQFLAHVDQTRQAQVTLNASLATPQEQACAEQVRRSITGSLLGEDTKLEIRNSSRSETGNDYVVHGEARVDQAAGGWQQARDYGPYSCTFIGHTEKVANATLAPPPSGLQDTPQTDEPASPASGAGGTQPTTSVTQPK